MIKNILGRYRRYVVQRERKLDDRGGSFTAFPVLRTLLLDHIKRRALAGDEKIHDLVHYFFDYLDSAAADAPCFLVGDTLEEIGIERLTAEIFYYDYQFFALDDASDVHFLRAAAFGPVIGRVSIGFIDDQLYLEHFDRRKADLGGYFHDKPLDLLDMLQSGRDL